MKLFNSYSRTKEEFIPFDKKDVKMYVCGITPYDTTHLGHAFTYSFFDNLRRYLTSLGYNVIYTQNVTDIDDDILKRAKKTGEDWQKLGEIWTQKFLNDTSAINIALPTFYVKATDAIPTILEMVEKLEHDGSAYSKKGNVYFRVRKFKDYGKLSHYTPEQMVMLSGERGADPKDPRKEDPLDFLLWQKSKPGEPEWESKWGKGRPGWHIECSAMNYEYMGSRIDIHGGGRDLIYPHHESEIAQSENFTGERPFVKYWLHTGTVMYVGEKMSKSLGNLVLVSDLLKKYSANSLRLLLASKHYRYPWEFEEPELDEYEKKAAEIRTALENKTTREGEMNEEAISAFRQAMEDDMDTGKAVEVILKLAKEVSAQPSQRSQKTLREMSYILGLNF